MYINVEAGVVVLSPELFQRQLRHCFGGTLARTISVARGSAGERNEREYRVDGYFSVPEDPLKASNSQLTDVSRGSGDTSGRDYCTTRDSTRKIPIFSKRNNGPS